MKIKALGLAIALGVSSILFSGCEAFNRAGKNISSSVGGLDRKLIAYDHIGNQIAEYEGRFDISEGTEGNKVKFDINGKRVMIYNAIVIVEEQ